MDASPDIPKSHLVLGQGYAPGLRNWLVLLALLGGAVVFGLVFTFSNPIKISVLIVFLGVVVGFLWLGLKYPVMTLCLIVAAQVLVPVYIRLPVPGLPSLPPPLLLMLGMICLSVLRQIFNPKVSETTANERFLSVTLLIYCGVLLVSIPNEYANGASYSMWIKTVLIPSVLFFVTLATLRTVSHLSMLFNALIVCGLMCGILGLHEYISGTNVLADWLAPEVSIEEDFFLWLLANYDGDQGFVGGTFYRVYSFFTQPLEYSAFMIMVFPAAALKMVSARTSFARVFFAISSLVIFAGFVVSFSRGPTLALIIVVIFISVYERRARPWVFAGAVGVMLALGAAWPMIAEKLTERITGTKNVTLRFRLWENGIQTFLENPVRGIGYGSYPNYHVTSIREHRIGPMYEYTWPHIERVTTMENIYITLGAETGVLGLGAFFLLIGAYFYIFSSVMKRSKDEETRLLALASCGGVLAYMLSGMTVANIVGYTISVLFFGVFVSSIAILSRNVCKVSQG